MSSRRNQGFSLVELIAILVVVSIGMVGLTGMFSSSSISLSTNEIQQRASQLAQECAEKALAIRRHHPSDPNADGFDWFAAGTNASDFACNAAANFSFSNSSSAPPLVGALFTGSGTDNACPEPRLTNPATTNNCRTISVTVTSTVNPALSASVTVLLVKTYQ